MGEYEDKIHAVNTEIDKTKLAIWEAEKEGKDTTALEAYLDKLYNDLKGLELQYDVAYNDALYQQQKAAEEALGQNVEMSIEDILAGIMSAGEDYAIISDLLADALTDQEAAGQEVEDAQAAVDAIEEVLAGAQEALEYYQEHLDKANDNLAKIEKSATNIFNNMMGISQGQSEILNKITQEITNQEKIYDTIKNETLPGIQESIQKAQELHTQAFTAVNDQSRVVLSLEAEIENLGALIEHTEQWLASLTEPEEQSYPDISHITPHATGGLITKPTLLSDLATGKPYGTMAETNAEWIVPTDKMGGFTLIQNIDMSGAVVRSDSDIDKMTDMVADKSYKKFTAALASKGIKI
jgi:septation ring formation regulator EzrA